MPGTRTQDKTSNKMTERAIADPLRVWAEMDRLTCLPTELISSIATHLDNHALLDFRLVCSRASECADPAFLARFFVDRQMLCTEYSLRVLWEISRNHRLRKQLHTLALVFLDVPYFHIEGHLQRQHQYGTSCDWQASDASSASCWNSDCRDHRFEILEWCSEILEAALQNLGSAGVVPRIIARDHRSWLTVPDAYTGGMLEEQGLVGSVLHGVNALTRSLRNIKTKPRPRSWAEAGPEITTSFILVAVARAHFPVHSLSLGQQDDQKYAGPEAFHALSGSLDFPWQNLRKLSLTVTMSCLDASQSKLTAFQHWLFSLRAIKTLSLAIHTELPDMRERFLWPQKNARLGKCLANMPLTSLTLDYGLFSVIGLLQILNPLRLALRRLELLNAYLDEGDRWSSGLVWMAQHLVLEHARFTLTQEDGSLKSEDGKDYSGWTLSGNVHEVRQKLEKMASMAVFKYDSNGVDDSDEFGDDGIADDDFPDIGALAM